MKVTGSTIQQLDKGPDSRKPKSRCRKWRLWATTEQGRKSRRFEGTYSMAEEALAAFVTELSGVVPNAETFGAYAEAWRVYRQKTGDYAPNTVANDLRHQNAVRRSPMWERRLDSITPETCRADLLWVKEHPQKESLGELSGTTMHKIYQYVSTVLKQADDDGKIASNPMEKVRFPKLDTEEKEALSWGELMLLLNRLDELEPNAFVMAVYAIVCLGLRRAEACALMDADVGQKATVVRYSVKERNGAVGAPKSKAGVRNLPTVPRFYRKVEEWRAVKKSKGLADAPTLACNVFGGVLRPQNLYRWWIDAAPGIGCEGITLHQLRHSNLTHMARHLSVWDLMRYAGWSSPEPARIYIHDDFDALSMGISGAWDATERTKNAPDKKTSQSIAL